MAKVDDVAAYILEKHGPMTAMKLQKLVYYSQAWSLVWDERPLYPERIEAWANGPVVPEIYRKHRRHYEIRFWPFGDSKRLSSMERETVDAVLDGYGNMTSQWLSDLSHRETPWLEARHGLSSGERGNRVITHRAMAEYYGSLPPNR